MLGGDSELSLGGDMSYKEKIYNEYSKLGVELHVTETIIDCIGLLEERIEKLETKSFDSSSSYDTMPTCTKAERGFLDELKMNYSIDEDGDFKHVDLLGSYDRSRIYQDQFKTNFKDLLGE